MTKNNDIKSFLENKFSSENFALEGIRSDNNILYHGVKIEHAVDAIKKGHLEPRTTQRYWEDGRYLKDDHPDYEDSGWLYGWSTSRDKFLASTFGGVLFVFDKDKIKEEFKVQPISWSYRLSQGSQYFKKEREDFIVSHKNPLSMRSEKLLDAYHDYLDSLSENTPSEYKDQFEFHRLHNMKPKNLDLTKCLKSIYINKHIIDIYKDGSKDNIEKLDFLMNHSLYKGSFDGDESYNKVKRSASDVYMKNRLKF